MKNSIILLSLALLFLCSCATFKSSMQDRFDQEAEKNFNAEKVDIMFVFSHYRQTIGFDAIPKLDNKYERIKGFDDFFLDALNEINNVESYTTFTNYASDVADADRRAMKDSLLKVHDYVVDIKFTREKSFTKFFFGTIVSSISATVIPIKYKYNYGVDVHVFNSEQKLIKTYKRSASLNKWVQTFMVFLYPFHNEKRKKEELYVEFLHDIFIQMESERIFVK